MVNKKEKSPHRSKHGGKVKRIFLRKGNKDKPEDEDTCEQSSSSPDNLRKVVSQKEIGSKFKGGSQADAQKVKIKMSKRGPFPSERLYNLEKIKSAQQSMSKLQTSRGKTNQDDSLYK